MTHNVTVYDSAKLHRVYKLYGNISNFTSAMNHQVDLLVEVKTPVTCIIVVELKLIAFIGKVGLKGPQ